MSNPKRVTGPRSADEQPPQKKPWAPPAFVVASVAEVTRNAEGIFDDGFAGQNS